MLLSRPFFLSHLANHADCSTSISHLPHSNTSNFFFKLTVFFLIEPTSQTFNYNLLCSKLPPLCESQSIWSYSPFFLFFVFYCHLTKNLTSTQSRFPPTSPNPILCDSSICVVDLSVAIAKEICLPQFTPVFFSHIIHGHIQSLFSPPAFPSQKSQTGTPFILRLFPLSLVMFSFLTWTIPKVLFAFLVVLFVFVLP